MNATEYWFLCLVIEARWALEFLESEDLEIHVNGPGHGLNHSQLVTCLNQLFENRNLVALNRSDEEFVPTEREIERALVWQGRPREEHTYFGLTALGGARWEAESEPNWNRYIYHVSRTDPDEVEIICADRFLAETYLSTQPNHSAMEGSLKWEVVTPWEATYWKTLLEGHRVTFLDEVKDEENYPWKEYRERQEKCWEMSRWYVNPHK